MVMFSLRDQSRQTRMVERTQFSELLQQPAGYCWSLYMTGTKKIGMPGHNGAYVPDYATRVYHNMATSLPLFSILYPAIRRYTVQATRKSETPVDCQSLKRKGGLLNNLLRPVKQFVQTPLITGLFEAFSFALCSISFSIFAPKMVNKGKGKKAGTIHILPAGTGAVNTTSSNPPSPSKEVVQENVDGTPPPSRPPSPPPSPPPSLEASDWSIEIEELSDEPPPGIRVSKDKKEPRRARRSSSWSRMMNSFRRKKSKELKPEDLYKTGPVPDDLSANSEVEVDEVNEPEETETPEENGEPDEEEIQVEETAEEKLASEMLAAEAKANQSSQPKNRLSRMLSFGTFGRRKSILVEDEIKNDGLESENKENTKVKVDSKQEKKRESKSETQQKADTTGKSDEAPDGESGEVQSDDKKKLNKKVKTKEKKTKKTLKEKSDTKNQMETEADVEVISRSAENPDGQDSKKNQPFERSKSNQKFMFNFKSLSKSVDHVKPEPVDAIEVHEQDTDSDAVNKSEPVGVKPKRKTIADFFKREKSSKVNEAPTNSEPVPAENLKKGGRFRSSFGRRAKAKSTEVDTTVNEETIQVESNKKPRRSTSMVFGSSFSLKKMFQNDPAIDSSEQNSANKVPGILTKRGKRQSNSPRPKSVQLDDKPREFDHVELRSSRGTIGERFITFTRESLRIKKRQRSVSVDEGAAAVDKILEQQDPPEIVVPENQEPITDVADDVELVMEIRTDDTEIKANPVAEIESEAEITTTTVIPSALHADFEPKHVVVSSSPPASRESHPNSDVQSSLVVNTSTDQQPSLQELDHNPTSESHKVKEPIVPVSDILLVEALGEILRQLRTSSSTEGIQLKNILENPHLEALLETHDAVKGILGADQLSITSSELRDLSFDQYSPIEWEMPADISPVRVVGLRKNPGEPLGLTVKTEDGQLVIARILAGGAVDRQGLLHVGDIIGEVNGVVVRSAEQLQVEIARCREHIQLKILPSAHENGSNGSQCCVRAHFDYDPKDDKLLPCPEIGLAFKKGDILQVVNQTDPNWWQAKKVGWSGPAGLIPSQELEERRKAFVAPEADFVHKIGFCGTRISKKKKKLMYQIKSSVDLDKAELLLYEEVTRMPPFRRKTLVLVGSEGIGRRTLKNRLINSDPDRFGTTMPHTSRPMRELEEDGMGYWFVSRDEMEHDVRDHQFLEFGEHSGHLYGTKLDSIRAVIRQGKMCVLDCSPNALKILHNSPEFMPYVIFLAAPGMDQLKSIYENSRYSSRNLGTFDRSSSIRFSSRRARTLESLTSLYEEEDFKNALEESARIQRIYEKYFDQIIVNEDPDQTFRKVVEALEILSNQHQWVPVSWVY